MVALILLQNYSQEKVCVDDAMLVKTRFTQILLAHVETTFGRGVNTA